MATENKRAFASFLPEFIERGFAAEEPLLAVLDGAKGLRVAVCEMSGNRIEVQRCQRHKRENVVCYSTKADQPTWRGKLRAAWAHPEYAEAKLGLQRLVGELHVTNYWDTRSLEESLTLQLLGVFTEM